MNRRDALSILPIGLPLGAMFATARPALAQSTSSSLVINVKDYGAIGDGNNDDTTSINNALAAISSTMGGAIVFPAGVYRITQSINIPKSLVTIAGTGRFSSQILADGNFPAFSIVGQGVCEIKDLTFSQTPGNTSTAGIYVSSSVGNHFHNLSFNTINGIILRGVSETFISNIFAPAIFGTLISLEGTQSPNIDIFIDTITGGAQGNFSTGIGITDGAGGIYISKVNLLSFAYGMRILGSAIAHIFCSQVIMDSCLDNAFQIESGNIMRFSQCWGATSNRGFNITGGSNIWLDGCSVINNRFQGVFVNTSGGVHIRNSQIARNSQIQQGAYHGIHVPPSISGVTVEGCRLGAPEPGLEKQGYGAFFDGGSSNYIVTGNDTRNNIVGGIFNGGSNSIVANNL